MLEQNRTASLLSSCQYLAATLSENFRNTSSFNNTNDRMSSISEYLSFHGLLLTMCFPLSCSLGFNANHISGSWINQRIGPGHIIPSQSGIGLLLDPSVAEIHCLYPTDGGTDGRDDAGCGPLQMDPEHGSQGASSKNFITRQFFRNFLNNYKTLNFGRQTSWLDIDCFDFFGLPFFELDSWRLDEEGFKSQSELSLLQEQFEAIMGHPVCTPPPIEDVDVLVYSGSKSWRPQDFQEVIDLQVEFVQKFKTNSQIWNEIIIGLPQQLQDLVLGVFYVDNDETKRIAAHAEAKMLGDKFVFKLKISDNDTEDVLECDDNLMPRKRDKGLTSNAGFSKYQVYAEKRNRHLRELSM